MAERLPADIRELHEAVPDRLHPDRKKEYERVAVDELRDRGEISAKEAARRRRVIGAKRPHVWASEDGEHATHYDELHTIPVYMDEVPPEEESP